MKDLKTRVASAAYDVDPRLVAEALLRRCDPRRDPIVLPPVIRPRARGRSAGADPSRRQG